MCVHMSNLSYRKNYELRRVKVLRSHTNKSHMEKDFPTWISQLRTQPKPKSNQTVILLVYKPNLFNCSWLSQFFNAYCGFLHLTTVPVIKATELLLQTIHYHFWNICTLLVDPPLLQIINFFSVPLCNCPSSCYLSYSVVLDPPPHFCASSLLVQQRTSNRTLNS